MNGQLQSIATIRERGQLTIPGKIREALKWASENFVVRLIVREQEIVLTPYTDQKETNWDKIWQGIRLARSYKGKRGNLSNFISRDRQLH